MWTEVKKKSISVVRNVRLSPLCMDYICRYCAKGYKYRQNRYRHQKTCSMRCFDTLILLSKANDEAYKTLLNNKCVKQIQNLAYNLLFNTTLPLNEDYKRKLAAKKSLIVKLAQKKVGKTQLIHQGPQFLQLLLEWQDGTD